MIGAYGPMFRGGSFCLHANGFFRALHRRHPLALRTIDRHPPPPDAPEDVLEMLDNAQRHGHPERGIVIGGFTDMVHIRSRKRIGFVVWEPSRLRASYQRHLRHVHEIWTPTAWGRDLLIANGVKEDVIHVVPEGVDAARFTPADDGGGRDDRPFRFLTIGRWSVRKGVDDLLAAFCREFAAGEPVELVLRCATWGSTPSAEKRIAALPRPRPSIAIAPSCDAAGLLALYRGCDAFVLPTKAEGWGLPITEAMACGLPVIVTNYSAPTDYLDDSIAYLIRVKSMERAVDPVFYPHRLNFGEWAQPDVEHLQWLLRYVYEHREEARETGRRARAAVCARLTWDHAAAAACRVLGIEERTEAT